MSRSPLRWFGAKTQLAPVIAGLFVPHRCSVELFAGSAAVTLAKTPARTEVLNDLDGEVVNLFGVLRCPSRALAKANALALTPYARAEWEAAREPTEEPVERARRFLVRSWQTHGHRVVGASGWRHDGPRKTQRGGSVTSAWRGLPSRVEAVVERLREVQIECRPALDVLSRWHHEEVLVYADPPYLGETRTGHDAYYPHDLAGEKEHAALLEALLAHPGPVYLSGYSAPLYEDALKGWDRVTFAARSETAAPRTEVLWSNRPLRQQSAQRGLFEEAT